MHSAKGLELPDRPLETRSIHGHPYQYQPCQHETIDAEVALREAFWTIQPGDIALDVGCLHGTWTLPTLAMGAAFVVAIDPGWDEGHARLQRAIAANGWHDRILQLQTGLSDQVGEESCWCDNAYAKVCPMTTLDAVIATHAIPSVTWIKIDTEGFEAKILRGAVHTLHTWHPTMVIEAHDHLVPYATAEIRATLDALCPGYVIAECQVEPPVTHLVCRYAHA